MLSQELVQMPKLGSKGDFKEGQPLLPIELKYAVYFPCGGIEAPVNTHDATDRSVPQTLAYNTDPVTNQPCRFWGLNLS